MIYFIKYWREVLITILLATCGTLYTYSSIKSDKLLQLTAELVTCNALRTDAQAKLDVIALANIAAENARAIADKKRQGIIATLTSQVNTLRKQEPPKECATAIDWAVTNKGDLSWAK
jgi:hypothetical protein